MLLYNTLVLAGNGTTDVLLVVYAKFLLALNERNKAHMNLVNLFKSFKKKEANITCGSLYQMSCFKEVLMLKTFFH
jgi:hypothetical protein